MVIEVTKRTGRRAGGGVEKGGNSNCLGGRENDVYDSVMAYGHLYLGMLLSLEYAFAISGSSAGRYVQMPT